MNLQTISDNLELRDGAATGAKAKWLNLFSGLVCLAVVAVVFIVNYNWIIAHFYRYGAYLFDSGAFANLLWRNHFNGTLPPSVSAGAVFNGLHFVPLCNLVNVLSYLVPLGFVEYFAAFEGVVYITLPLAMFMFLNSALVDIKRSAPLIIIAGLSSLLYAFNGFALISISYPDFQMLWPAMALGFFFCLFSGRIVAAAIFFVFVLSVREDAGFHLFGFLALVILLDRVRGVPLRQQFTALIFAVAAFAYSLAAIGFEKFVFHNGGLFALEFLGDPPYGHLTWGYVPRRLLQILDDSPWICSSFVVAAAFAILDRKPSYLLGYLATVPWVVLYMLGPPEYVLHGYRTFPIALAMVWPALEMARAHKFRLDIGPWLKCCAFIGLTTIFSMVWFFGEGRGIRRSLQGIPAGQGKLCRPGPLPQCAEGVGTLWHGGVRRLGAVDLAAARPGEKHDLRAARARGYLLLLAAQSLSRQHQREGPGQQSA